MINLLKDTLFVVAFKLAGLFFLHCPLLILAVIVKIIHFYLMTQYPVVPGHEIIGHVTAVGSDVSKFNKGDLVGVGCLVDSCGECASCKDDLEQYCQNGMVLTYGSPDPVMGG